MGVMSWKSVGWGIIMLAAVAASGQGFDPHSPGPIGDVTPDTGQFTQTTLVGTNGDHDFLNVIPTYVAPSPFCWPRKLWQHNSDNTINDVMTWGYNCSGDINDNYMTFTTQNRYFNGLSHYELYYIQARMAGGSPVRPQSFNFNTDNGTELIWRHVFGTTGDSGFRVESITGASLFQVLPTMVSVDTNLLLFTYSNGNPMVQVQGPNVDLNFVVGNNTYTFAYDSRGIFPSVGNAVDIGNFATGYFGTAVSTPKIIGIHDTSVVHNLNADKVDGHPTTDFTLRVDPPAGSSTPCTSGQWASDSGYVYLCTPAGVWARSALSSW